MADTNSRNVHYLETEYQDLEDKCLESPLPIALDITSKWWTDLGKKEHSGLTSIE
jgi:hypothetical protein